MAALQAHIAEHTAFMYRQQMEQRIGAPLPVPNAELPEEQAAQLASLMATAGQQLTQKKQADAQQAAAQQKAQDPVFQMAQRELVVKENELKRKAAKDAADVALDQERLDLDKEKAEANAVLEANRIASQNNQAQAKNDQAEAKVIIEATRSITEERRDRAEAERDRDEALRDDREDR